MLVCVRGHARVRHVSQRELSGIDPSNQKRTIGAALAGVRAGDRIIIHGGVYREELTVERSGSAGAPISLEAAEGEYVILTGADHLTKWTKLDGDQPVYSTSWPHKFVGWNEHHTHPGQGLFHWGVPWKRHERYESLKQVQGELSLAAQSRMAEFRVEGFSGLDLRVPADSPAVEMNCYPQGPVPRVRLGIMK